MVEHDEQEQTGRRRRQTDVGEWHDRLVEHFGADGRGGEWARAMKTLELVDARVSALEQLKWKLLGMVTLGGVVAGVITVVLGWAIGFYGKH